jgi:plastocyanin domain-containing protein
MPIFYSLATSRIPMNNQRAIFTAIVSLSVIFGAAQVSQAKTETTHTSNKFSRIEQPLSLKILVTLGGLGLIGAQAWWFLLSKTKTQQATSHQGIQELEITVDGGYTPDRIVVQVGQLVRLNFFRKDPSSCLEKVLLPDFHKALNLQVNQTTTVEFIPEKPGEYTFHCGMNMFRGVLVVQKSNDQEIRIPAEESSS